MAGCNDPVYYDYERGGWQYYDQSDKSLCLKIEEVKAQVTSGDASVRYDMTLKMNILDAGVLSVLRGEISSAVSGIYGTLLNFTSWVNGLINTEQTARSVGDSNNTSYTQLLHDQQEAHINYVALIGSQYTNDQNIAQNIALRNEMAAIEVILRHEIVDGRTETERIKDAIGSFINDPIGWLLRVFASILIPFASDEIGTLIAPDTASLPPRNDYRKLFIESLIQ